MRSMHVRRWAVGLGLSGALVAGCHMGPGFPDGPGLPGTDQGTDLGTDGGADGGTDLGPDGGTDGATDLGTDGATDGGSDGGTDGGSDSDPVLPTPLQSQLLAEVNEVRTVGTTCGGVPRPAADPLTLDDDLAEAAQGHADWMAETGMLSHTGEGGSSGGERITAAGYQWSAWGENIAWGQETVEAAVAGWYASPDHCNAFMDPQFDEVGFGRASSTTGVPYWVANLASPA